MAILEYIVWGLALFFAGTWTFGLIIRPDFRLKSTIVTIVYWWIAMALAFSGNFAVFHLIWFMPIALFLPSAMMMNMIGRGGVSTVGVFVAASVLLAPTLALLIYLQK